MRRHFSNEELLHHLRAMARERASITLSRFCRSLGISQSSIYTRFESWPAMREAAGLPRNRRCQPRYSDAEIMADLEQVWRRTGRCPNFEDYSRWSGKIAPSTICKRFGKWPGVRARLELHLRELGLKPEPEQRNAE
jgi:hypothetical protein